MFWEGNVPLEMELEQLNARVLEEESVYIHSLVEEAVESKCDNLVLEPQLIAVVVVVVVMHCNDREVNGIQQAVVVLPVDREVGGTQQVVAMVEANV